jgi:bifunctional non-homologous end joining protein LigD
MQMTSEGLRSQAVLTLVVPMPLASVSSPFDDPDWFYELKYDGFRALAYIDRKRSQLVSRRGHVYRSWVALANELSRAVRCHAAVLDGEICCLDPDGRPQFYNLLFRRGRPHLMVFDLLWLDGCDLRERPLRERKRLLRGILPQRDSCVRFVDHIQHRGTDLFRAACAHDVEGVVAKWRDGTYQSGPHTSWLKIRNPHYSQWDGRRELFEARRDRVQRPARWVKPELSLR